MTLSQISYFLFVLFLLPYGSDVILEQATFFTSVPNDSSFLKLYEWCGKYPLGVVHNRMALIESSAVYIHPRGNLPAQLAKPVVCW